MARVEIKMIDRFLFETELIIKKADINIANHVGNDTFVSLMQEARIRFFKQSMFNCGMVAVQISQETQDGIFEKFAGRETVPETI